MTAKPIGRLAMRHEGEWWNAYWAMPDTMVGAIHLGSLRMRVASDKEMHDRFLELMRDAMSMMVKEAIGGQLDWPGDIRPAPESERSGHG